MSDLGIDLSDTRQDGPRRGRRRSPMGCLAVIVALVVLVGGGWFVLERGVDAFQSRFAKPADYPGPGHGKVLVEVKEGETASDIGDRLEKRGVVETAAAFRDEAAQNPDSLGIQVGFYELKREMAAEDALERMIDPKNLVQDSVTIPEGFRIDQIVDRVAAETKISRKSLTRTLMRPQSIGLPASAKGNPEGYLFPETYAVRPNETARSLLGAMVEQTETVQQDLDMEAKAEELGLSVEEVMVVASILEYEGFRDEDLPKIARVLYNRLDDGMALQLDSTVAYANGVSGTVWTTEQERANDSPYNTYKHVGLPPGPIGSAGERTLDAALNPAEGNWLFFIPVNLETGETVFNEDLAGHNRAKQELLDWCRRTDSPNCA